jgi:hypothetical protein
VITYLQLQELVRRMVFAADEIHGPFNPSERVRLQRTARQTVEGWTAQEQAEWLKTFRVCK